MNKVYLADFKHMLNEKELLNPSRFWLDLIKSRNIINQEYGENLLRWTGDVRRNLSNISDDACVGGPHVLHFLETYIGTTEMEAYQILTMSHDLMAKDGPIQSLKKLVSSNQRHVLLDHENLSRELDSLAKQHMECVKTLQDIKEKGLKSMAVSSTYEKRISQLKSDLEKTVNKGNKSHPALEKKIRSLESKLQKQTAKEKFQKIQYESLLNEEQDLMKRLRKSSDQACQDACDLHERQIDTLVSILRDVVVKTDPSSSGISDRTRPMLKILDQVTCGIEEIVNSSFDLNAKCYIFPDVQAWHEEFGFLNKLPTPVIRPSNRIISHDPKIGAGADIRLAQEVMSSVGQTTPSRKPWTSRFGPMATKEGSSIKITTDTSQAPGVDVRYMDDVYVRVISPFKATHPEHLPLKPGMLLKQKFPADTRNMAFGWYQKRPGGTKKYGFYPAAKVILD